MNKNGMNSLVGRYYSAPNKTRYYDTELGFSLSDFIDDPKAALQAEAKKIETTVKTYSQSVLPESLHAKASELIKKEGDKLVASAKDAAVSKLSEMASDKSLQDKAITGGVQAAAEKVSSAIINIKDIYRTNGIKGLFKTYPVPFYIGGGVAGLLVLRFVMGGKKKVYVAPNPTRKKKRKSKK
jgi:hypothetical protein